MEKALIKSIAAGSVIPTIGKYTKDGQDLDYLLTFERFDPLTGQPVESAQESVSRAWVEAEIAVREQELADLNGLLDALSAPSVTVIADYSGQ